MSASLNRASVLRQACRSNKYRGPIRARSTLIGNERNYASSSRLPGSSRPSRIPVRSTLVGKQLNSPHSHKNDMVYPASQSQGGSVAVQIPNQPLSEGRQFDVAVSDEEKNRNVATPADMKSVLSQDTLVVTREIEMMNIFIGFEQANKYALNTNSGETVGYIAEVEEGLLGGSMRRQLMRTHRPFKATVMDTSGNIVMIIKRNFTWINSYVRIYTLDPKSREEVLLGEVHQVFHIIRRKYELFVNRGGEVGRENMEQFADIDEGLWAWDFMLKNDFGRPLGAISRNFRGFGRELFTDTGQYVVTFDPSTMRSNLRIEDTQNDKKRDSSLSDSNSGRELMTTGPARALSIQERAVTLAAAVSADFDYFSRHSENSHGSMLPWIWMGGGSGSPNEAESAPTSPDGQNTPATQSQDSSGVEAPPPIPGSDGGWGSGVGTAAGYDALGGGQQQQQQQPYDPSGDLGSPPPPSSTADLGEGSEEVWGSSDPFGAANSPSQQTSEDSGWGWGNSGGRGGGGGDGEGGGGGWLDGWFDS